MPHCIHSTKRCDCCGLNTDKGCIIPIQAHSEHVAPQHFDYRGYFVPITTEKLDASVMAMLSTFNEEG